MSEQSNSCEGKPLLVLKANAPLAAKQMDDLRPMVDALARRIGAESAVLSEELDLSVLPVGLPDLVKAIKEQARANLELAASIRLQSDAIADLVETVARQGDDDDEPEGLGHLGTL